MRNPLSYSIQQNVRKFNVLFNTYCINYVVFYTLTYNLRSCCTYDSVWTSADMKKKQPLMSNVIKVTTYCVAKT